MAYRLHVTEPVEPEVRRVVLEQIDKGLAEIHDEAVDRHDAVHQVRKRCKKVRAVLRLVRGSLSDPDAYSAENAHFRDAARGLSGLRDAEALLEAYDKLMEGVPAHVDRRHFTGIHRRLSLRKENAGEHVGDLSSSLKTFARQMEDARGRIASWHINTDGPEAIEHGLKRTYRRSRRGMDAAYVEPTGERFHEWRKRVKYHWYHCRLLRDIWPPIMKARIGELDTLADLLGDYHDLVVLKSTIESEPEEAGDVDVRARFCALLEQRQGEIRREARPLGQRLFVEKPKHINRRFRGYWDA
jgi:CHAD domain-containing protein